MTANKASAEATYVSTMERVSLAALEAAEATQENAEITYAQILTTDNLTAVEQEADSLRRAAANLSKALAQTYAVSDEISARCRDIKGQRRKRKFLSSPPANATIDLRESSSQHFARGLGVYKLLLICFIGSFLGVVVEVLWCYLTHGRWESRAGLVYGPFNLLYGTGAVVLTACLYQFRNRSGWISFLGGMLVGSVVEYACSWAQELLLGSRSWDYSHMPFNLNGRICLLYSVFWGTLGVLWIKDLYPRMARWVLKIPNKPGKIITLLLTVFFVFNAGMSAVSVYRWSERVDGLAPSNAFEVFLDERFPDTRLERIYPGMDFSGKSTAEMEMITDE